MYGQQNIKKKRLCMLYVRVFFGLVKNIRWM